MHTHTPMKTHREQCGVQHLFQGDFGMLSVGGWGSYHWSSDSSMPTLPHQQQPPWYYLKFFLPCSHVILQIRHWVKKISISSQRPNKRRGQMVETLMYLHFSCVSVRWKQWAKKWTKSSRVQLKECFFFFSSLCVLTVSLSLLWVCCVMHLALDHISHQGPSLLFFFFPQLWRHSIFNVSDKKRSKDLTIASTEIKTVSFSASHTLFTCHRFRMLSLWQWQIIFYQLFAIFFFPH